MWFKRTKIRIYAGLPINIIHIFMAAAQIAAKQ
jgi:hypothetical protein